MRKWAIVAAVSLLAGVAGAIGGACDYRPSAFLGELATAALVAGAGAAVTIGATLRAVVRAAASIVAPLGVALMSPFVMVPAAAIVAGVSVFEAACFLPHQGPEPGTGPLLAADPVDLDEARRSGPPPQLPDD